MEKLSITIPFMGFYETTLAEMPNESLTRELEEYANTKTEREVWDLIYSVKDYSNARIDQARRYLEHFQAAFNEKTGLKITFEYDGLESPREYNFTTDRLFAKVSYADAKRLYRYVNKEVLRAAIKERFTSRSGFISSYSNDLAAWQQKPILQWDHNELGTMLTACCVCEGEDKVEQETMEAMREDYCNGRGVDIQDDVYNSIGADKKKVVRLKRLLDAVYKKARAA